MDKNTWNLTLSSFPQPQLLQTWEWGEVKAQYGWKPYHRTWQHNGEIAAMALVLERTIQLPGFSATLRMHYTPKGPLLRDWQDAALRKRVLDDLAAFARKRRAFLLKIDADVPLGKGVPGREGVQEGMVGVDLLQEMKKGGWLYSNEQIQFKNTVLLDLTADEEEILARMKQKTRYNVRLAGRKGMTVREGSPDDFDMLYQMYAETAVRDGFTIRGQDYYQCVWSTFYRGGMLTPLIAEVDGEAVSGLMLFHFDGIAWYLYGMSRPVHREKMPTYLLQWQAIKTAKARGCRRYDLWGAPDEFTENDPLWGVFRFKDGLGGEVMRHIGAWDLPLRPWLYWLYTQFWPRLIELMRLRGDAETRKRAEGDL